MKNPIKYLSYKDSEVEWLHEIPSHWKIVKAKRIFHEITIKNHPDEPLLAATQTKGVIPKSLYENTTVTATKNFETLKFVRKGDFVISLRSFQGGIEYAHYQGIISPAYTILEPQEEVVHNYYRYLLKSKHYISGLTLLVTGIREGQNIDTGKFKDSFLPLPTKEEQTAIAAFLDFKLAKIDRFIRKKKQLIKLLNEQKVAIINQAVTKGLNPNVKMKPSGIEWLGDIPEHWEVSKIKYVKSSIKNSFVDGPFGSNLKSIHFIDNGDVYVVESGFITTGKFLDKAFKSISKEHFETISRSQCIEGDVIIAKIGANFGMGAILPKLDKLSVISGNSLKITLNDKKINKQYFVHLLSVYKKRGGFIEIVNASAQPALSLGGLNLLKMPLPSLNEQNSIIEFLNKEIEIIEDTISTIEKEIDLVEEYKTALIAEAVTGKIDVRNYEIPEPVKEESYEELEEELSIAAESETEYETEEIE